MNSSLKSRNVTVNGRRTSLRLEDATWQAFDQICDWEKVSPHQLCSQVEAMRKGSSRTSTVRAFIVTYFRTAANQNGAPRAGLVDQVMKTLAAG